MLVNDKNKCMKEWMMYGLLTSAYHKQYISMKFKNYPNNLKLALHYTKYKNTFTKTVRLAKLTWKLINEVTSVKCRSKD